MKPIELTVRNDAKADISALQDNVDRSKPDIMHEETDDKTPVGVIEYFAMAELPAASLNANKLPIAQTTCPDSFTARGNIRRRR